VGKFVNLTEALYYDKILKERRRDVNETKYYGIFSFSRNVGSDGTVESFRIVLTES